MNNTNLLTNLTCLPTFLYLLFHELYISSAIVEQKHCIFWSCIGHTYRASQKK